MDVIPVAYHPICRGDVAKDRQKEQKEFFERMQNDENFIPNPEGGDKSFFEKVKDMFS